uniref:RING-type E3 ubiquitin transferase n=1 Tax=Geotrypetes seraphini TaxID=260995 RepID=A0A6P8RKE9_GEOSA|nr:E3 ubiquitin-protein ligase TRIM39-like isoform X2 [Geotrypetes seraphini]
MAAANPAQSLREEVSCSLCLDYFSDPVTTVCGHNFCRPCITQSWEGSKGGFPCPLCRKRSRQKNLRANRQLAKVAERVKNLYENLGSPVEEDLCEKHKEKVKLFCEEDQTMICLVCRESRDHRAHLVTPIEEAVQEYKEKLEMQLEPLREDLEDLLEFKSAEGKKAEELRSETEIKRQKVESEFEELHQFLNKEKQVLLSRLEEEEEKILQRIRENVSQLEEQSSSFTQLISEIEEKRQQPDAELLKDVKDTLRRCQKMTFPKLKAVSTDLKMDFDLNYPQRLKKLIIKFGVNVTLDVKTAFPYLFLSEDQKSVGKEGRKETLPDNPERFDLFPFVLGCEGFTSGRHYWEVEVGNVTAWIVGVCKESVRRKGAIIMSPSKGYQALWCCNRRGYWALTSPQTQLQLRESLQTVGILLDYEAGKVSFYNADTKSHLFTFTGTLKGKLRPLFSNYCKFPLRIRPVQPRN